MARRHGLKFPCAEVDLFNLMSEAKSGGASLSQLRGFMEALTFARFVFELESFRTPCASRKCWGLGSAKKARLPSRAAPLRVSDLVILHSILRESADYWDRLFAGCCLFCVYARARWSDAQHAGGFQVDTDRKSGKTAFFEAVVEVRKTMNRKGKEPVCLELVSPGLGITFDDWVRQFLNVREKLGISRAYPFMPAPNSSGEPTIRALASDECSAWLQKLLPDRGEMPTTSHSLKSTILSYCAKYGLGHVDRLALGGHSHPYKISDTYARDALARPLRLLAEVLEAIREKYFFPDESRAGRFKEGIRLAW